MAGGGHQKIANDKNLDVCVEAISLASQNISNGWIMAFYSCKVTPEFMHRLSHLKYFGEIIWDKKVPGLGGGFRYQHENISIFKVGMPKALNAGFSVISDCRNPDQHPHQKPQSLMTQLIKINGGELILDPFMGSGSTGVACAKLGRKFIGIELEEKYFDIACKRIADAYKQPDMFISAPPEQPKQESLI